MRFFTGVRAKSCFAVRLRDVDWFTYAIACGKPNNTGYTVAKVGKTAEAFRGRAAIWC